LGGQHGGQREQAGGHRAAREREKLPRHGFDPVRRETAMWIFGGNEDAPRWCFALQRIRRETLLWISAVRFKSHRCDRAPRVWQTFLAKPIFSTMGWRGRSASRTPPRRATGAFAARSAPRHPTLVIRPGKL